MQLGLRVQLGHTVHETCCNLIWAPGGDLVILDVNGIHEVGVDFCSCELSQPHLIQLLQYCWFPASVDHPKTAATMVLLKFFQLLNFESKASPFEFHKMLACLTDNTGTSPHKVHDFTLAYNYRLTWLILGSIWLIIHHDPQVPPSKNAETDNERLWLTWRHGDETRRVCSFVSCMPTTGSESWRRLEGCSTRTKVRQNYYCLSLLINILQIFKPPFPSDRHKLPP